MVKAKQKRKPRKRKSHVRSAKTGRYVEKAEAKKHPDTTVSERDHKRKRRRKKNKNVSSLDYRYLENWMKLLRNKNKQRKK